jgi:GNAT superfamily N-acetyltransferase
MIDGATLMVTRTIETVVTYLEMTAPPKPLAQGLLPPGVEIRHAVAPTVSFYRYLYDTIGQDLLWTQRRLMPVAELGAILRNQAVEVNVLWVEGVPAGYLELDWRAAPEIELAYFGLIPEFIGRGLGRLLLDWGVAHAWRASPTRLWVHTCDLDHPNALRVYQNAGFAIYDRRQEQVDLMPGMPLPAHRRQRDA